MLAKNDVFDVTQKVQKGPEPPKPIFVCTMGYVWAFCFHHMVLLRTIVLFCFCIMYHMVFWVSYPILPYPVLSYPTLSYPILPYPILPYPIL